MPTHSQIILTNNCGTTSIKAQLHHLGQFGIFLLFLTLKKNSISRLKRTEPMANELSKL